MITIRHPVPSDIEIAQEAVLSPIKEVAEAVGLTEDDLDYYGKYKAKVHLDVLEKFKDRPQGKYIDVTAITPTPLGPRLVLNTSTSGRGGPSMPCTETSGLCRSSIAPMSLVIAELAN